MMANTKTLVLATFIGALTVQASSFVKRHPDWVGNATAYQGLRQRSLCGELPQDQSELVSIPHRIFDDVAKSTGASPCLTRATISTRTGHEREGKVWGPCAMQECGETGLVLSSELYDSFWGPHQAIPGIFEVRWNLFS